MNRVAKRSIFALVLVVALLAGLILFCVRYVMDAGQWVTFPGSPHVYSGSNLNTGMVYDRNGTVLLDSTDGRYYAADPAVRKATMHILGDRYGYIPSPLLDYYADDMIGYNPITGVYNADSETGNLILSLDAEAQAAALQLMAGRAGTVGVYNYETGEILCAVTSTSYDPDDMPDVENDTTGQYEGVYVNRFFHATYTPGSIFKLVTAAAAIEEIPDIEQQSFYCEGSYVAGDQIITCDGVHGQIGFQEALAKSCNCAFGQIAQQLGKKTMNEYAQKLGIATSLSFDGIHTAAGNFDVTGAAEGDLAWAGIGQHTDQINACQYMMLMGQIANGGKAATPYLASEVRLGSHTRYEATTKQEDCSLQEETTQRLSDMMRYNVETVYGTWQFPDVRVCAKSGTAEVGDEEAATATFSGFIQDEAYPLAFIVIVEGGGYGSTTCAPIAGAVLQICMDSLDGR